MEIEEFLCKTMEIARKPRQELENCMLRLAQMTMTKSQYYEYEKHIKKLTDDEIIQLSVDCACEAYVQNPTGENTNRDYLKALKKLQEINGVTHENCAANDRKCTFLDEKENKKVINAISNMQVTDIVELTSEEDEKLFSLWSNTPEKASVPSDILFSKTIPVLNMEIRCDETSTGGRKTKCSVHIFDDYYERLLSGEIETIGYLSVDLLNHEEIFLALQACKGFDTLLISSDNIAYNGLRKEHFEILKERATFQIMSSVYNFILTWYSIQIALLHPTVKEVFQKPQKIPVKNSEKVKCKNKIKYVKKHLIKENEIDDLIYGKNKSFHRHALIWYVTGHWRTYKNGKKIFIQPYFKGTLRETKKIDDSREREIII